MLKHYIKITTRYLFENKLFSIINLLGLAIALCIVFFTFLYVRFELSYDQFNSKADRIYRISIDVKSATGTVHETSAAPLANELVQNFPEVENAGRFLLDYFIVSKDLENFGEETVAYADSSVFSIFSFPLLKGNIATLFSAPFSLVISETAAKKYFGSTNCLNKTLQLDGEHTVTVTGIMKDMPANSHWRSDLLLSMSTLFSFSNNQHLHEDWKRFGFSTYILLKDKTNFHQFKQKLNAFDKKIPIDHKLSCRLVLEPLKDLYLRGSSRGNKAGATTKGNYNNIYIFSFVALFVLIIACFNYINLRTALSLKQAKEIGVQQVMGATKRQLTIQFIIDALLISSLAFLAAIFLGIISFPWFNELVGKTIIPDFQTFLTFLPPAYVFVLLIGLLSGIYPAFFLTRFKPNMVLKGKFANNPKGLILRKSLVIIQFVVFTLLTVATMAIYKQLHYMRNDHLGFKKEHNLVIDFHYDERINGHLEQVKSVFMDIAGIDQVSFSAYIPGRPNRKFSTSLEGENGMTETFQSDVYFIDNDFLSQYGIELLAGRNFSDRLSDDVRNRLLINETCLNRLGYTNPQDVIGKRFTQLGANGEIIGVVKDFHFQSMHKEIQPLTLQVAPGFFTFLTLSISTQDIATTIKTIEEKWQHLTPGLPLIYSFTDETFNAQYQAEERFAKLFISLAICSISIACLGLLGLVSFNTLQRTKEIGVRKVLGASSVQLFYLLTKEYVQLIGIAFLLSIPIGWIALNKWLESFAYRIDIRWWIFLFSGSAAMAITFMTVSFQAIRAALTNPVDSLRDE
ncbi:ABC transporter permease [Olivibacter sp. CPCC 100613]|uniref:ABC transporter permease n=1 Tax=Olivibacter sp. CPCC 100613 TaxID=3079931 RepID=UPI002FF6D650